MFVNVILTGWQFSHQAFFSPEMKSDISIQTLQHIFQTKPANLQRIGVMQFIDHADQLFMLKIDGPTSGFQGPTPLYSHAKFLNTD
jgi:hypothetical protein